MAAERRRRMRTVALATLSILAIVFSFISGGLSVFLFLHISSLSHQVYAILGPSPNTDPTFGPIYSGSWPYFTFGNLVIALQAAAVVFAAASVLLFLTGLYTLKGAFRK